MSADPQQEAIKRFEHYAKLDPSNVSLLVQLADLYHQHGRFDDALGYLQRCRDLEPQNVRVRSRAATVLISMHRFAEAQQLLAEIAAAGDQDAALQHNLGLTLYYQHSFAEARKHFEAAAERGLSSPYNYAYLARSLHHLGEMKLAIDAGKKWVELASTTESKSYLALLHTDGGDIAFAQRLGLEVLAQDPDNIDANVAVGSASMEQQKSEDARRHFGTAIRRDPENGRAWLGMGLVHLYDQEIPQATEAFFRAAEIFPENAGIAVTLAWSYIVNKDPVGGERAFKKAVEVDRTFAEAHAGLAAALALQGKKEQARAELDLARRLDRKSFGAVLAESFLQAAEGDEEASAAAFSLLLSQRPRADMEPLIEQLRIYTTKLSAGRPTPGQKPH